jgi:hypothetical protein
MSLPFHEMAVFTGVDMNYHLVFNLPGLITPEGTLDATWLALQGIFLWAVSAAAIVLSVKKRAI